mmetsp:Transcript_118686/g.383237  ORF Transcript_118686/g.383237 Transcript_118686/m.383237 type:complete len:278 (+) Transcript_118686:140-973(+)
MWRGAAGARQADCAVQVRSPLACLVPRELAVEKLGDLRARVDLRLALPAEPGPDEGPGRQRHVHRGPEQRRPALVLRVPLVAPVPDARARLQLPRVGLLQAVLHAHEGRLPLRRLERALLLRGAAGPVGRRRGDLARGRRGRAGVWLVGVLEARAAEVPQHAPRGVRGRLRLARAGLAGEAVRHAQELQAHDGAAAARLPLRAPLRRAARAGRLRAAEGLQRCHEAPRFGVRPAPVRGALRVARGARAVPVLQQELAPAAHEEAERALRRVALRALL